ncbi:MAG: caspase family protein [Nitrospirota bacterium]
MARPRQRRVILLVLLAFIPSGCSLSGLLGPKIPEYRGPSDIEIEQLSQRMMGKAPKREVPVSTDGVQVVFQTGHAGGIRTVALSPNGRYIASSGRDTTVKIWDVASGQEVRTLTGFDMLGADLLVFSQDGARVTTKDMTGGVKVFEVASGREVRSVGSLASGGATVSADGRVAVSHESRSNHSLTVTDMISGQTMWTLPDTVGQNPVALSPDGKILLTLKIDTSMPLSIGSFFGFGTPSLPTLKPELLVWDLPAKKLRRTLPVKMTEGAGGKISLDGRWLLHEEMTTRNLILTDIETGKSGQTIVTGLSSMSGMMNSLTFSPDGKVLAFATSDGTAQLLEIPSGRVLTTLKAASINFSQDGRSLVLASEGGGAPFLRELASGKETRLAGGGSGVTELAVMPDGRGLVAAMESGSAKLWDLSTGQLVRTFECSGGTGVRSVAVNDNAAFLATGCMDGSAWLWDVRIGRQLLNLTPPLSAGEFAETIVQFTRDGRRVLVAVRIWNLQVGKELASLIALGREDFVAVTPDQFYRASKTRIKGVAFRVNNQLYPFEQFDLRFNRPDVVLGRLGMAPADLVQSYRLAYERRLKKMGLTEKMLGSDFHLPTIEVLTNDVPVSLNATAFTLRVKATDSKYLLDRFNVFVNDIPIYGSTGLLLPNRRAQTQEQDIQVPLVPGRNKIQVSVLNQPGVESLKQTVYTTSTAQAMSPDVYVVAIGVSDYKYKAYNLRYAAKDATDLLNAYQGIEQRHNSQSKVHVLSLTDKNAIRPEILKAKEWLKQSRINDLVVVFAAGHGMTDEQSNYYFGTHDIDPKHPANNGLPYEEFENLLDGIPALQKVLLLDTCFSGEIERDQAVVVAQAETGGSGTVKMRSFKAARGVTVVANASETHSGTTNAPRLSNEMVKFQQDWFADLRRGTGAAVISSSSGNEYSLEGEQWKNGVFTYALLNGLKNRGADANKDQTVTVSELQSYVIDQVRTLTEGGQNPTVRRENLEYDFAVY